MNILFLTMVSTKSIDESNIYTDLMRVFVKNGDYVAIVSPAERRYNEETKFTDCGTSSVLRVKVGNLQKTNIIEKGVSTLMLESQFLSAIKKYYSGVKFDIVMYSTPPITFCSIVNYIKRRDGATSYLLLKDIFPQNAVDLGMFSKASVFYKFFRRKEEKLYRQSDYIGCMSEANVKYLLENNTYIDSEKVHVSPNCIEIIEAAVNVANRHVVREKHDIPADATVFVYGGNLGRPQGIPYIIDCLKNNTDKCDRFFVICGSGTEYPKIKEFIDEVKPDNVLLINGLPKDEYDELVSACDVGLIFLDNRFTIPNFPSRLLSYMQAKMPVIACTDTNTDVGSVVANNGFGWWCESKNAEDFTAVLDEAVKSDLNSMGEKAYNYLKEHYSVETVYSEICAFIKR